MALGAGAGGGAGAGADDDGAADTAALSQAEPWAVLLSFSFKTEAERVVERE